jgi:hypothetical protein
MSRQKNPFDDEVQVLVRDFEGFAKGAGNGIRQRETLGLTPVFGSRLSDHELC